MGRVKEEDPIEGIRMTASSHGWVCRNNILMNGFVVYRPQLILLSNKEI